MKIPRLITVISIIVFLYSFVVIAGWVFGIDGLTRILPHEAEMKFPTALCFLLGSVSLYFMAKAVLGKREIAQIVIPACALCIGLITATLLAAGIFQVQTGLESLFGDASNNAAPGIPALPTLISLVLFCIVSILTLFGTLKVKKYLLAVGFCIGLVGLIAIFGYAFRVPLLYFRFDATYNSMALNTAVLFMILGIGTVFCSFQIHKDRVIE